MCRHIHGSGESPERSPGGSEERKRDGVVLSSLGKGEEGHSDLGFIQLWRFSALGIYKASGSGLHSSGEYGAVDN